MLSAKSVCLAPGKALEHTASAHEALTFVWTSRMPVFLEKSFPIVKTNKKTKGFVIKRQSLYTSVVL